MKNGKILVDGAKLKNAIIASGYTQKEIDEYFGFAAGMKNYISRGYMPISIKDSLEHKFGIMYKDYEPMKNYCENCADPFVEAYKKAGWYFCPWCGRKL